MSFPTLNPNRLKLLTYNVSWEALQAEKSKSNGGRGNIDMGHCIVNGKNVCLENIAKAIQELGNKADFIALQEVRFENERQWKALYSQIKRSVPDFDEKYDLDKEDD